MKYIILGCLVSFTASCASRTHVSDAYAAPVLTMGAAESNSKSTVLPRKVIQSGRMGMAVKDVEEVTSAIEAIVKTHKGHIDQQSKNDDVSMEVRIPADKLNETMAQVSALGKVSYEKVWTKDVTDKYIDVEAKLRNLKLLRGRLMKLYDQSKDVKDLLEVEKELARVQGEIDSLEVRLKAIQRDVAYSKLDLTIKKETIPGPLGVVGKGIGWTFKKLWVLN
jgi:hypothetical protein